MKKGHDMALQLNPTSGIRISFEREEIEVTMGWTYTADETWRHTDSNGHEHRYDRGYPTLDHIIDQQHWCDGSEGFAHHDPHWAVDESHYECKQCREVIEPALDPPGTRKFVPGRMSGTIEGDRSDGVTISAYLTADDYRTLHPILGDEAALQAFIDAIPDERIYEWRI